MSDKTKRLRDDAHIRATTKLYTPPEPERCECGKSIYDNVKIYAVDQGRGKRVKFYCEEHLPEDVR